MSIYDFIVNQVQHNQFVSAALIAAPATAITYALRAVPMNTYRTIKKWVSITLRFNSDMSDYEAISRFITKEIVIQRFSRNYTYATDERWDENEGETKVRHHGLIAGYGTHFGRYRDRWCVIERHMDEGNQSAKYKENLSITFFGKRGIVHEFASDLRERADRSFGGFKTVPIFINSGTWWQPAGRLPLRSLSTIFTSGGAAQRLHDAVRDFESQREENHRLGLPHHLGILLYGEPGCGKSSLIHALASSTERSIHYLNLGSVEKDKELTDLVACGKDWSRTLLVLEDFDAAGVNVNRDDEDEDDSKSKKSRTPVTLSAMLNVLDGLISPDGMVTIATTNHPEKLDEALKRAGRFDYSVELGKLDYDHFLQMCDLFSVSPDAYPMQPGETMSGAAMRAMILDPLKKAA